MGHQTVPLITLIHPIEGLMGLGPMVWPYMIDMSDSKILKFDAFLGVAPN